jgi:cytochrome c-type biogenesis protein CcmH/NrfF
MHPALTILWLASSAILAAGTVIMIVALRRAPEGEEGPDGFRYVNESEARRDEAVETVHGQLV